MKNQWLERLGNWNPQLMRELQELRISNLLIATTISVLGQFLLLIYYQSQSSIFTAYSPLNINHYCVYPSRNDHYCLQLADGNYVIHWQLWWLNLFTILSLLGVLTLLVGGVYLLVSDLATEQRRGTLNFIRLSPQSSQTILLGKILGVPSLLYLGFILAIPLHLWAGLSAKIPLTLIVSFYLFLIAGCLFFYSAAILFGLINFSPWLASGIVLIFLLASNYSVTGTLLDWLFLFSPNQIIHYLIDATSLNSNSLEGRLLLPSSLYVVRWFQIQIGTNIPNLLISALLNYSLWSYWIWQAIKRRYSHPQKTLLTKQQSYLFIACFEIVIIGFTLFKDYLPDWKEGMIYHYRFLLGFNLVMFLVLITLLTPSAQSINRAEYPHRHRSLLQFIWSNSVLSLIAVNLAIASAFLIPWILFNLEASDQIPALFSLLICWNFILICAVLTQIIVLRIAQKTALWIAGTFGAIEILPVIVLNLLRYNTDKVLILWLFTPYAWVSVKFVNQANILFAILMQWSLLGLCTLQMVRDIKKIGESTSKALFTRSLENTSVTTTSQKNYSQK